MNSILSKAVKLNVEYLGDLHCKIVHEPSGSILLTDAPKDNLGRGEFFSPTDLIAASMASCIATTMAIVARNSTIDLIGLKIEATKEMAKQLPRRISRISLNIHFPHQLDDKEFELMKNVVKACPVGRSLDHEVEVVTNFSFD